MDCSAIYKPQNARAKLVEKTTLVLFCNVLIIMSLRTFHVNGFKNVSVSDDFTGNSVARGCRAPSNTHMKGVLTLIKDVREWRAIFLFGLQQNHVQILTIFVIFYNIL